MFTLPLVLAGAHPENSEKGDQDFWQLYRYYLSTENSLKVMGNFTKTGWPRSPRPIPKFAHVMLSFRIVTPIWGCISLHSSQMFKCSRTSASPVTGHQLRSCRLRKEKMVSPANSPVSIKDSCVNQPSLLLSTVKKCLKGNCFIFCYTISVLRFREC